MKKTLQYIAPEVEILEIVFEKDLLQASRYNMDGNQGLNLDDEEDF